MDGQNDLNEYKIPRFHGFSFIQWCTQISKSPIHIWFISPVPLCPKNHFPLKVCTYYVKMDQSSTSCISCLILIPDILLVFLGGMMTLFLHRFSNNKNLGYLDKNKWPHMGWEQGYGVLLGNMIHCS